MQTLTIEAVSLESARGFYEALQGFEIELREGQDQSYHVTITLGRGDTSTVEALNALERYVATRGEDGNSRTWRDQVPIRPTDGPVLRTA